MVDELELMRDLAIKVEQYSGRSPRRHGFSFVCGAETAAKLVAKLGPMMTHRDLGTPLDPDEIMRLDGVPVRVRVKTEPGMMHLSPQTEVPAAGQDDIDAASAAWSNAARGQA